MAPKPPGGAAASSPWISFLLNRSSTTKTYESDPETGRDAESQPRSSLSSRPGGQVFDMSGLLNEPSSQLSPPTMSAPPAPGSFLACLQTLPDRVLDPFSPGATYEAEPKSEVRASQANGDPLDVIITGKIMETYIVEMQIRHKTRDSDSKTVVYIWIPHEGWRKRLYNARDVRHIAARYAIQPAHGPVMIYDTQAS